MVKQLSRVEEEDSDTDMDARLEYIERYHELLDNKEYNSAAMHAAISPQGILRTSKTLQTLAGTRILVYYWRCYHYTLIVVVVVVVVA